jgi:hypothetical protein
VENNPIVPSLHIHFMFWFWKKWADQYCSITTKHVPFLSDCTSFVKKGNGINRSNAEREWATKRLIFQRNRVQRLLKQTYVCIPKRISHKNQANLTQSSVFDNAPSQCARPQSDAILERGENTAAIFSTHPRHSARRTQAPHVSYWSQKKLVE